MVPQSQVSSRRHEETLEDHLAVRPLPSDLKRKGILAGVPVEHQLDEYRWVGSRDEFNRIEEEKQRQYARARAKEQESRQEWVEMQPTRRRNSILRAQQAPRFGKERMRRMSNVLEAKLRERPAMSELADMGYVDDSGLATSLHPAALSVQSQMINRATKEELMRRGIIPNARQGLSSK